MALVTFLITFASDVPISHYGVGKESQGDCIYYNPEVVKNNFQNIMENKYGTSIFQTLSQREGKNEEFV